MQSLDWEEKKTMEFKGTLIVVKDCNKALKFYQDMFGFELIRDHDGNMELSGNLYLQEEKYWERFTGRRVIPQRNPAICTRTRYRAECRSEARSSSMTACVQAKTVRSTGDIAA